MASSASSPRGGRAPSPTNSQLPPIPASPAYSYAPSIAGNMSNFSLAMPPPPRPSHAVLTKADLEQSQLAYSDLLAQAKVYRLAMATLSQAASAFGASLESCARLKEARADFLGPPMGGPVTTSYTPAQGTCTADMLMSASGVHHLIANHQQILSETVYRSFEVPLLHDLDKWKRDIEDENAAYKKEQAIRSAEIKRLEKEGLKLHRQRRRDVSKFREHLVQLTSKLDGLTNLHAENARSILRESQDASLKIVDASCSLVRAEVDIFEGLAKKGWTGGGLDDLLEKGQDLFASDDNILAANGVLGHSNSDPGAQLFSILPHRSILPDAVSDQPRSHPGRADSLVVDTTDRYQSLTGAVSEHRRGRSDDGDSIFSEFNQSRGVRPFSPQPIRREPKDVVMDPDSLPEASVRDDSSTFSGERGRRAESSSGDSSATINDRDPTPTPTPPRPELQQKNENGERNNEDGNGNPEHNREEAAPPIMIDPATSSSSSSETDGKPAAELEAPQDVSIEAVAAAYRNEAEDESNREEPPSASASASSSNNNTDDAASSAATATATTDNNEGNKRASWW